MLNDIKTIFGFLYWLWSYDRNKFRYDKGSFSVVSAFRLLLPHNPFLLLILTTFVTFHFAKTANPNKGDILLLNFLLCIISVLIAMIRYKIYLDNEKAEEKNIESLSKEKFDFIKYELQIIIDKIGSPKYEMCSLNKKDAILWIFKLPKTRKGEHLYNPKENILTDIDYLQEKLKDEKIDTYIEISNNTLKIFNQILK